MCLSVCLYLLRYELLSLFLVSFEENSKREVREVDRKTPLTLIRTFIRIIHRKTHLCT